MSGFLRQMKTGVLVKRKNTEDMAETDALLEKPTYESEFTSWLY